MTQEQKQEFTRRISQENHSGLILVLCDIFHTYGMDAMAAYEAENMTTYLQTIGQARRAMQELIRACVDLGVQIEAVEERNRATMEQV